MIPLLLALSLNGGELSEKGWKEIARCPGHSWEYLMKKDGEIRLCSGINSRGGPKENPCSIFTGKISSFKKCQNRIHPKANL